MALQFFPVAISRGGYRAAATSKMQRFVVIINGFQPLTVITKCSILDAAVVLDPPLHISANCFTKMNWFPVENINKIVLPLLFFSNEKDANYLHNINKITAALLIFQKQPPEVFYGKWFSSKFSKIHRKTSVLESLI